MDQPQGLHKRDGLTLLLTLGMVYVFATATLPALLDRHELRERRQAVDADVLEAQARVDRLRDWHEAGQKDPLVQERMREAWRLSPDAPGYRVEEDTSETPGDPGHR
jgi:hypothetical protein